MTSLPSSSDRDARIEQILADYLRSVESGAPMDRLALLEKYPDVAEELQSFFTNRAEMERLAAPLRGAAADTPTLGMVEAPADGHGRIRYFGDYELLEELGRGGMGVVYKARQKTLNRMVALKMILSGQLASPADVQRFKQEAEAAANLDHPNIAPIYETGEHQGQHYFSMKLIEGSSLSEALPELRHNLRAGIQVLTHSAKAVHHAHQRGVLHRDLKPGNVLLDKEGIPFVTDFGLAKRVEGGSDMTRSGATVGTPSYMAPEQANGAKQLTTAVDVYSLGAILYELLTGRPPFKADSPLETLLQVMSTDPVRPRRLNDRCSRDLETIALKCLNKDPAKRYDSAAAFADDLERWLRSEPIVARRASSLERTTKWARRRPAAAALLGVTLGSVVLVAALLVVSNATIRLEKEAALVARNEALVLQKRAEDEQRNAVAARNEADEARSEVQQVLDRERRVAYANNLALAYSEWRNNQLLFPAFSLDLAPEELRGWEWNYLNRLFFSELLEIENVREFVAFSPDGKMLASGEGSPRDGDSFQLWDADTGQKLRTLCRNSSPIEKIVFSQKGQRVASGVLSNDMRHGDVAVWDLEKDEPIFSTHSDRGYHDMDLSPDGRLIAVCDLGASQIVVHDVDAGQEVLRLPLRYEIAFSRDGRWLAGGDAELTIWDVLTGEPVVECVPSPDYVRDLEFSPDGRLLAAASGHDRHLGEVNLFDTGTGRLTATFSNHTDGVKSLAFSPDGTRIASAGRDTVRIWSVEKARELFVLPAGRDVLQVAYHPDGRRLATLGDLSLRDGLVRIWDVSSGLESRELADTGATAHNGARMAVSFDGTELWTVAESGRAIMRWDVTTGRELDRYAAPAETDSYNRISLLPKGEPLALLWRHFTKHAQSPTSSQLVVCNPINGQTRVTIRDKMDHYGQAVFSPDGKWFAFGQLFPESTLEIWNLAEGKIAFTLSDGYYGAKARPANEDGAGFNPLVSFNADGTRLFTSYWIEESWKCGHRLYDTASGKLLAIMPLVPISTQIGFSPDGQLLAFKHGDDIEFLRSEDGSKLATLREAGDPIAFSHDSRRLATTRSVWDLRSGKPICEFKGALGSIGAWTPDGKRLATGNSNGVDLWDTTTGSRTYTLQGLLRPPLAVRFTPDGQRMITMSDDAVRIWDASNSPMKTKSELNDSETGIGKKKSLKPSGDQ